MNYKLLGLALSTTLLLGACGAQDTAKEATKETTKKAESTKEVKAPNSEAEKALNKAKTYSDMMLMSKKGIYNQLTSEADKFKDEDAQWAVDNLKADYKKNAAAKAKDYSEQQSMSKDAIKQQLTSQAEAFTEEEATYAISQLK
ncbi:Ltp family lipoprotein [Macrococcus capreoli]|uniref:Ltp family lipoprotein n=1 Tax=Macrococcus capreoli TaxID=2982690 RepID=UPI003EE5F72E